MFMVCFYMACTFMIIFQCVVWSGLLFVMCAFSCGPREYEWTVFIEASEHERSCSDNAISYLIYMGDVSNPKGDGINIELVIIKGQLLCVPHYPGQTCRTQAHFSKRSQLRSQGGRIMIMSTVEIMHGRTELSNKCLHNIIWDIQQ